MGLVWDCGLPKDEKYILLAYADHADHEGRGIYPAVTLIAWKTGYSVRQVQRITKQLIAENILVPDGMSQYGTNNYRINLTALPQREPRQNTRRGRPSENGDICAENGDIYANNGDICAENGDIAMSPEPSINRHIKPSDKPSSGKAGEDDHVPEKPPQKASELEPSTPGGRKLFARLQANAKAKGRRGPRQFETPEQRDKFLVAEKRLPPDELERAITAGLEAGAFERARIIAWVAKWGSGNGRYHPPDDPGLPQKIICDASRGYNQ